MAYKVKDYLECRDIYVTYAKHIPKASVSEHMILSFKKRIYKYMYTNKTNKYTDVVTNFVQTYNESYHRSI